MLSRRFNWLNTHTPRNTGDERIYIPRTLSVSPTHRGLDLDHYFTQTGHLALAPCSLTTNTPFLYDLCGCTWQATFRSV